MITTTDSLVRERAAGAARGRWLMLAVLLAGQFMALLDVTIVNVAMPTIGRSLHASGAELQLVVAGYTVSYAMMLITGADRHRGRAGPRFQPAGDARPGPGAAGAGGGRERAAHHDDPARPGGRGGQVRQPVPDAGFGPGSRGVRARAGGDVRLAGGGDAARGCSRESRWPARWRRPGRLRARGSSGLVVPQGSWFLRAVR